MGQNQTPALLYRILKMKNVGKLDPDCQSARHVRIMKNSL